MATYRLDGCSFNRDNLRGIDAGTKNSLTAYLNKREREINTIETRAYICAGGPFDGQSIELQHSGAGDETGFLSHSRRGIGRANRYPCNALQPLAVKNATWARVSTPSATTLSLSE